GVLNPSGALPSVPGLSSARHGGERARGGGDGGDGGGWARSRRCGGVPSARRPPPHLFSLAHAHDPRMARMWGERSPGVSGCYLILL
ncbi:hypothetical protein EG867_16445, partial [Enterococcus faecalis]